MRTHSTQHFFSIAILAASPALSLAQQAGAVLQPEAYDIVKIVRDTALKIIRSNYFDSTIIDTSLSIQEIVSRLDPFSTYETKPSYERFMYRVNDEDIRYGIGFRSVLGHILLTSVAYGSPADNMGILPGDEILAVGGKAVGGNDSLAYALLSDREEATLQLYRASTDSTWSVAVHRARFETTSVPVAAMIDSQIGYVSVTGFHSGTAAKLRKAVDFLRRKGMSALIIDLRSNSGGYVGECLKCANLFIHAEGQTITENSLVASHIEQHSLSDVAAYPNLPIAVLVGNYSCSAAEMFSGIMQDLDRAVIVGQPTFGKSLVMRFYDLPNNDRLYLAIAYYMLPSGRSVQRPYQDGKYIGLEDRDYGSCDNSRHTIDSDLAEVDCPKYKTTNGRSVIPFSGIVPDYLVSQEEFYPDWLRDAVEGAAALYMRVNSDWLVNTAIDSFEHYRRLPQNLIEWVLDSVRAHDTTSDKLLAAQLSWMVPKLIKADVAYGMWYSFGFFKLWERNSATVRRAAALLSKPATIALLGK